MLILGRIRHCVLFFMKALCWLLFQGLVFVGSGCQCRINVKQPGLAVRGVVSLNQD